MSNSQHSSEDTKLPLTTGQISWHLARFLLPPDEKTTPAINGKEQIRVKFLFLGDLVQR